MIAPQSMARLQAHPWPGNVRQLRNVIEASVLRATGRVLGLVDLDRELPRHARRTQTAQLTVDPDGADYRTQVKGFETALILSALRQTGGNQCKAAVLLGLPKRTLFHKIRVHGVRQLYCAEQRMPQDEI
jgi:DNA-binding NtrC family response regulator